ncbi:MAG: beta-galactosidase GalA [Saprospiraceae bacterium]
MKFQLNILLSFLMILIVSSGSLGQIPSGRTHQNFDSDWRFHLGHAADAKRDFNFSISNIFAKTGKAENTPMDSKFNDSAWQQVQLPHDWAVALPFVFSANFDVMAHGYKPIGGLFPETSVGWYRKNFDIPAADSMKRFTIQFDGIFRHSQVWLNGFYLGLNESGYLGMTYDITDYIKYGGSNTLVVRADASQYEGWFYEGAGIYRHVWLNSYSPLHFRDNEIFVNTAIDSDTATASIAFTVENESDKDRTFALSFYIRETGGFLAASKGSINHKVPAHGSYTDVIELSILHPKLWSLGDPQRYQLNSRIYYDFDVVDSVDTRFGIRSIEMDAVNGLTLNGKPVKIQGVNCHQDHAAVGSALPDYLQYYRIRLLKEMGVNAYRSSHNAPTPELLEACDSLGMLVMDENRLLNSSPEQMAQWERLILRDRNHPSIFMWSIGNEEGLVQTNSIGRRIARTLIRKQRELDPSRRCTYAADVANIYSGINEVIPVRGFNYRIDGFDPYHKDHPRQPLLGTEMGSTVTTRGIYVKDSIKAYVPDQDITYPWWANTAEQWWSLAAVRPWLMGGFIWTGFDYRGEPTPYEWPNINSHFGVMDMCGFPKNIYYYYKSWWSTEDVLHISPHWNWPGDQGKIKEVWVNSNAEQVELFLNGKSLGKKTMPAQGHLIWNVPYKTGKLEAIGYRKGRKSKASVETTGLPIAISLQTDLHVLKANGQDATVVNVVAIDAKGREVPDANLLVNFELQGEGKILGVGNGDPSSHEPDQYADGKYQRQLFNGKAQIILQSGNKAGILKLSAVAIGLKAAEIEIQIK